MDEAPVIPPDIPYDMNQKLLRCADWLQKQDSLDPKKLSLQNKNDIQFIIQTQNDRKNFLIATAEDERSIPSAVDEPTLKPKAVPLRKLRLEHLHLECEWQSCGQVFSDYEQFQKHVPEHTNDSHAFDGDSKCEYVCLWDVCGHKTWDLEEMTRHMNYHTYHSKLMAIGFNGRATLKLPRCNRDSSKRNRLPPLKCDHCCMWTGCAERFNSIQKFFDHVKVHISNSVSKVCSWAGCGATFPRRVLLTMHVRSHTRESLIGCYHCGAHFSCNQKLNEHLTRQNVNPNSSHVCSLCGIAAATAYLLREHQRQHISAYACALCDMSAPSRAALAQHVRYRHFAPGDARAHACPHCAYRAVTKSDLRKHIPTHTRKKKRKRPKRSDTHGSDKEASEEENSSGSAPETKKKSTKKYACHMCPRKQMKVFSRGTRLTTHLLKVHGAQWPFGHSRFRYQISEDGMYRLTTTRFEFLDVSKKIVDGYSGPKESLTNTFEFNVELKAVATDTTPAHFEITLKNDSDVVQTDSSIQDAVEITVCDVDENGNIINSKVISDASGIL